MELNTKVKKFREIVNELADLYEKKNHNYGDSFGKLYEDLGPIAGLVPLHNKLDRLTNLIKNNDKNHFESIEDNFKDLANYAIMNLIEMEDYKRDYLDFTEDNNLYVGDHIVNSDTCKTYVYSDDCVDKNNNYVNTIKIDYTKPATATTTNTKIPYKIYAIEDVPKVGVDTFHNDPAKDPFKYLLDDEEANRKFHSDLDKMIEDDEVYSNEH